MKNIVTEWLKKAENDLIVAKHVFEDLHPKQLEISCYLCHQAAEKSLKAFLIYYNCDPEKRIISFLCVSVAAYSMRNSQRYLMCVPN